ncbi:flagellar protein FlaF [Halorubrum alkaliphilum]|uniref:Flagellar protein FlaF n=1 Tax=Halorubrum alkaliphilum TaxID=261290 RepID=A0A8T4GEQ3_9EURY|nr:flagellin [Halorubrum alkaliphilum]MBP1922219.1 flagellar protein FlaF [Halorubrum alkaliphilum]
MGVSVSASTAIIVAGLFFAFTAFYPVAANGFDRVTDAQHDVNERALEQQNTALTVESAELRDTTDDGEADELVVTATNDGSVGLVVSDTTLLVDNAYLDVGSDPAVTTSVDGVEDTDLWLGGERLSVRIDDDDVDVSEADRVVIVTESGVRDTAVVTEAEGS